MGLPSQRWFASLFVVLLAGLLLAQKSQRPPEEEETPAQPKPMKPPEVEETPIVKKRNIRVDDDAEPVKPRRQPDLVVDLARAAKDAKDPVKRMFLDLAKPVDLVTIRSINERTERCEPIPIYVPPGGMSKGKVTLKTLTADGQPGKPIEMNLSEQTTVEYYETLALARVEEFRKTPWHNLVPTHANYVSLADQLAAVEQVLMHVMRFHEAARQSGERKGDGWDPIQEKVRKQLLSVVMERLQLIVEKGDWDEALALASQLSERFPGADDQRRIAKPLGTLVEQKLRGVTTNDTKKYEEVQRQLKSIADLFPLSDSTEGVAKALYDQADNLVREARASREKDPEKAARLVQQAEEICPQYPGIHGLYIEYAGNYPILRVGVPQLPVHLSPALARTESEMQAIEMMFESLVQLQADPDGGTFVRQLASTRPQALPLGREFLLSSQLYWSNGKPLNALAVRDTVNLLREWSGRNEVWAQDLLDRAVVDRDPYRVKLQLRQGYIEPLAPMNFKILPPVKSPDDPDFAKKPVSSGPFVFQPQQKSVSNRTAAYFKANTYYSNRPGCSTLPNVREIQFLQPVDVVDDMSKGFLHLLLDVPADKVAALRATPGVSVSAPMPTRRVYFLAVNHRNPHLAQPSLRRALAHAIARDKLLDAYFRASDGDKMHQPLNGPYPQHSWAYNSTLKADLYNAAQAKSQLEQAEKAKAGCKTQKWRLKYPDDDPRVRGAMEALATQIQAELKITVDTVPVASDKLWEAVQNHDYELAYCHYDFPDPMFDIWPLFDPRATGKGGLNYLGYEPNAEVTRLFQNARSHRDFSEVRKIVHTIHELLVSQEMPFIPLWHLDRQIAVHRKLTLYQGTQKIVFEKGKAPQIDPLRLFGSAETWKVDP